MVEGAMIDITQLKTGQSDFWPQLDKTLAWESVSDEQVFNTVNNILKDVKNRGDAAVIEYTNNFDRMSIKDMSELEIPKSRLEESLNKMTEIKDSFIYFKKKRN